MHMPNFVQVLLEGTVYDLFKTLVWAALMTGTVLSPVVRLIKKLLFHHQFVRDDLRIGIWG